MNDFLNSKQFKYLTRGLVATSFVLAAFLAVSLMNAVKYYWTIGESVPQMNLVSFSGEGEIFAIPDVATFSFTVEAEKVSVKEAQDAASTKINGAIDALKKAGVAEKDIRTIGYNAYPRYEYRSEGVPLIYPPQPINEKRVLVGYNISQTIEVKIRETDKAGDVLGEMGKLGITNISGLSFTIDNDESLRAQARQEAIQNAQKKATELARNLGVSLKKVVGFYEEEFPRPYYSESYGFGGDQAVKSAPAVSVPAGENKITSRVTITYEVK